MDFFDPSRPRISGLPAFAPGQGVGIPSKYAKTESEQRQEANLRYVLETRTKHTLILANLSDFEQ